MKLGIKTLTEEHDISHFQQALDKREKFYFEEVLCYCDTIKRLNETEVRICSLNKFNSEFYPYKWITLKSILSCAK